MFESLVFFPSLYVEMNMVVELAFMEKLVFWCGIGHFLLCLGSLLIPNALGWNTHLKALQPLLRQMFWTYAAYILVVNFGFGVISVFAAGELLNGSFLARALTLFIALYWLGRIGIQFFYFARSNAPQGGLYTWGEIALVALFSLFTIVYFAAFCFNNSWI